VDQWIQTTGSICDSKAGSLNGYKYLQMRGCGFMTDKQEKSRILIIEDEKPIADLLAYGLTREGFQVQCAGSAGKGWKLVGEFSPSLVLLDWMLPDISGVDLCRIITERYNIPIVMLTAKGSVEDKLYGLETGADDYITKPFDLREVIARVKSILRRFEKAESERAKKDPAESTNSGDLLCRGPLVISRQGWTVTKNGRHMDLTPKEFELLVFLLEHPGQVFTRATLLEQIWGYDFEGDTRTVDIHIQRLRKKLGNDVGLSTVFGVGYKYEPQKQAE